MKKNEAIKSAKNFDGLLDIQYGKRGTKKRDEFEEKAQVFVRSETLKGKPYKLTEGQIAGIKSGLADGKQTWVTSNEDFQKELDELY